MPSTSELVRPSHLIHHLPPISCLATLCLRRKKSRFHKMEMKKIEKIITTWSPFLVIWFQAYYMRHQQNRPSPKSPLLQSFWPLSPLNIRHAPCAIIRPWLILNNDALQIWIILVRQRMVGCVLHLLVVLLHRSLINRDFWRSQGVAGNEFL